MAQVTDLLPEWRQMRERLQEQVALFALERRG
jgi:hypothetical protein